MIKFRGFVIRLVVSVLVALMSLSAAPLAAVAAESPAVTRPEVKAPAAKPANPGREITPDVHRTPAIRNALLNLWTNLQGALFRIGFLARVERYGGLRSMTTTAANISQVTDRIGSMAGWEDLSMNIVESGFFRLFYNDLGYNRQVSASTAVALRQVVEYAINHPEWFD